MNNNISILLIIAIGLVSIGSGTQARMDYSKDPYVAIKDLFGPSGAQTPDDCDDKLKHITAVEDPQLNKRVFVYTLHRHGSYEDGDRCSGDYSRQRVETSVNSKSPTWMHGVKGKQFTFSWKFLLDKNFQQSGDFCHLHQIKLDGSDVGNPNLTVTARQYVQLENQGKILCKAQLKQFLGNWVQVRNMVTYNANGCVTFSIHRIKDGVQLMSYNGCGVQLDNRGVMIRPKFGFYRSLSDKDKLRDESVRIVDICIGEGNSCNFNQFGQYIQPEKHLVVDQ